MVIFFVFSLHSCFRTFLISVIYIYILSFFSVDTRLRGGPDKQASIEHQVYDRVVQTSLPPSLPVWEVVYFLLVFLSLSRLFSDLLISLQIYDPQRFLKMSSLDKRNTLRASGVVDLPRPREGIRALDLRLQDLMDDAVRAEVIRIGATSSAPDLPRFVGFKTAGEGKEGESRQSILRKMCSALEEGEVNLVFIFILSIFLFLSLFFSLFLVI